VGKKVLAPTGRREAMGVIRRAYGLSARQACRLVGMARTSCGYEQQRKRKRIGAVERQALAIPTRQNERWSMDGFYFRCSECGT